MLKVGEKAPDFILKDRDGKIVSLKDFKNQWVIVYFYPKADTPGCTTEACDFTASIETFTDKEAVVIGISNDSEAKIGKFIDKHDLKIILLSDPKHEIIEKYGAWTKKSMYGKEYMGTQRSTFLINPEGMIEKIWDKVSVKGHVEEVKNLLINLKLN